MGKGINVAAGTGISAAGNGRAFVKAGMVVPGKGTIEVENGRIVAK